MMSEPGLRMCSAGVPKGSARLGHASATITPRSSIEECASNDGRAEPQKRRLSSNERARQAHMSWYYADE
jgi:hypothetical protein